MKNERKRGMARERDYDGVCKNTRSHMHEWIYVGYVVGRKRTLQAEVQSIEAGRKIPENERPRPIVKKFRHMKLTKLLPIKLLSCN